MSFGDMRKNINKGFKEINNDINNILNNLDIVEDINQILNPITKSMNNIFDAISDLNKIFKYIKDKLKLFIKELKKIGEILENFILGIFSDFGKIILNFFILIAKVFKLFVDKLHLDKLFLYGIIIINFLSSLAILKIVMVFFNTIIYGKKLIFIFIISLLIINVLLFLMLKYLFNIFYELMSKLKKDKGFKNIVDSILKTLEKNIKDVISLI